MCPAPASLLSLPSCPFQELDVPRTLPHRCQQPGRTRSCPGKELAEQQPWKVPSEPARKPQACRNICSQLGWGTLLAEQALCGSPSREPFPTECIFLHGFPIRVQDVTSWVGFRGAEAGAALGFHPCPSRCPSRPHTRLAESCGVSVPPAEHHPLDTQPPQNRSTNETDSAACNYFPRRQMINSAQELRLSANSPELFPGRLRAAPPGQGMLRARESLSEIWLKKSLMPAPVCCPSAWGLEPASEGFQLPPRPHWVPGPHTFLQEPSFQPKDA